MIDELFLNLKDSSMDNIFPYEKYLVENYNNELLEIYKNLILNKAKNVTGRSNYRNLAINAKRLMDFDNGYEVLEDLLNILNENVFRNKPAMKEEFGYIFDLDYFLK